MDEDVDHYRVLGVSKDATKQEIKAAFRKLAMKLHPDKQQHNFPESPKSKSNIREVSNHKFRQISQAYELLIDDRKRADYNNRGNHRNHTNTRYSHAHSSRYSYSYKPPSGGGGDGGFVSSSRFELALRFLTTRAFLLNLSFACALLGGLVVIDIGRESLWKRHNSGVTSTTKLASLLFLFISYKSFEEAMESIEKTKADKDKKM